MRKAARRQSGSQSETQDLIERLQDHSCLYAYDADRMFYRDEKLSVVFSEILDVYQEYREVMILDRTYNTNAYNRPLLNFVSVKGGKKTAHLGFAMLDGEFESYAWFGESFKDICRRSDLLRQGISSLTATWH